MDEGQDKEMPNMDPDDQDRVQEQPEQEVRWHSNRETIHPSEMANMYLICWWIQESHGLGAETAGPEPQADDDLDIPDDLDLDEKGSGDEGGEQDGGMRDSTDDGVWGWLGQ